MYSSMLATVIAQEFDQRVGRGRPQRALNVEFRTRVDFDREEGYRHIDLRLWAPGNYVAVLARRRWNVIAQQDLEWDDDREDTVIRRGADYTEGASQWYLLSYHDSGWRGALQSFLVAHEREINRFGGVGGWSEVIELSDADVELAEEVIRGRHFSGQVLPEGFAFPPAKT